MVSFAEETPPDPVGAPLLVSGGHAWAQAPEQLDVPWLSATHRYRARPEPSVRYVPFEPWVTLTTAPEDAAFEAVDDADEAAAADDAVDVDVLPLLPHPAAINATARTAMAATTTGILRFLVCIPRFLVFILRSRVMLVCRCQPCRGITNQDSGAPGSFPSLLADRKLSPP